MSQKFTDVAKSLDRQTYERIKTAVELRKWPNGDPLSEEQLYLCMQAVIAYEDKHMAEDERTGFISQSCKSKSPDASVIISDTPPTKH